jgi:hypothetical protein
MPLFSCELQILGIIQKLESVMHRSSHMTVTSHPSLWELSLVSTQLDYLLSSMQAVLSCTETVP